MLVSKKGKYNVYMHSLFNISIKCCDCQCSKYIHRAIQFGIILDKILPKKLDLNPDKITSQSAEYGSFRRDLGCARQNLMCASVQTCSPK